MKTKIILSLTLSIIILSCDFFDKKPQIEPESKLKLSPEDFIKKYEIKTTYDFNQDFVLTFKAAPDTLREDYYFIPDITFNKKYVLNLVQETSRQKKIDVNKFFIILSVRTKNYGIATVKILVKDIEKYTNDILNLSSLSEKVYTKQQFGTSFHAGTPINIHEYNNIIKTAIYLDSSYDNFILVTLGVFYNPCEEGNFIFTSTKGQKCDTCGPLSIQFSNKNLFGSIPLERNTLCD
jgi:hypothetical protein